MSSSHRYWVGSDDPTTVGAMVLAAGTALLLVPEPGKGASRGLTVAKVLASGGKVAPDGVLDLSYAEWLVYQFTAPWIAHTSVPAWTLSEKGVLVPETDGTAALVEAAAATWPVTGGWDCCERLTLAPDTTIGGNLYLAGVYRLVRYTGTRPAELGAYRVLYADGVAEAVALLEPIGGQ